MENADSYSDCYISLEQMIRRGERNLSEVEHLLDTLVKQQKLRSSEEQALLALAWEISADKKPSA